MISPPPGWTSTIRETAREALRKAFQLEDPDPAALPNYDIPATIAAPSVNDFNRRRVLIESLHECLHHPIKIFLSYSLPLDVHFTFFHLGLLMSRPAMKVLEARPRYLRLFT